jgi:ferric-dicitrate binding protein FerR (iron transport regulator)
VKDKREASADAEDTCQRLGDLVGLAVPVEARPPSPGQWAELERHLDGGGRGPSRRRRWVAFAMCATLALCVVGWLVARRPLGYRLQGCTLAADGNFETAANRGGSIAFDDGSQVAVEKDARFRLGMLPFGRGAEFNLDEGQARLAVVHRAKTRWVVLAGPFRVDVTGTRFGVLWSRHRGQFRLVVLEGEVCVGGGPIPLDTHVRAGQTVNADLVSGTFEVANARASTTEKAGEGTVPAVPALPGELKSAGPQKARPSLAPASPRKLMEPIPRASRRFARKLEQRGREPAEEPVPPPTPLPTPLEPGSAVAPAASGAREEPPSTFAPAQVAAEPTGTTQPTSLRVVIGETGQLANGFTGATWIASGDGTSFSSPSSWEGRARLLPEAGLLCTSGTVAGLSCLNEGMPQMQCNWGRNWGVAIGWHARADHQAWGDEAARGIAVEFRGRSASYRLNAHLKGDPLERVYCIENYKSGQVVRPSMFKSECWFDKGETLEDFRQVDTFNLQFSSGMSYVAFRYCVSAIMLFP